MRIKIYDGHSMVQIRLEMRVSTTVNSMAHSSVRMSLEFL